MRTRQRMVRLPVAIDDKLRRFCEKTRRTEPFTVRSIVELFFADGPEAAELRLVSQLWSVDGVAADLKAFRKALREMSPTDLASFMEHFQSESEGNPPSPPTTVAAVLPACRKDDPKAAGCA